MSMIDDLKKAVQEVLTPAEYDQWLTDVLRIQQEEEQEPCLIEAYFAKEREKPAHLRKDYVFISCPCRRCNPYHM